MYAQGYGVKPNIEEAIKWYQRAAQKGNAKAQLNMGALYAEGNGVEKNDIEAVEWYRKAAKDGYDKALYNLALMYKDGRGVPRDYQEAEKIIARGCRARLFPGTILFRKFLFEWAER